MNKKLHIGTSPLTNTIFAGTVLKDGKTWGANKQDVTIDALVAVAQHVINFGKPVEITSNGELEYVIACASPERKGDWEKAKENARLIAAAPELLEALELLIDDLALRAKLKGDDCLDVSDGILIKAQDAIAKAKGEQ